MTTPPSGIALMDVEDAGRARKDEDAGGAKALEKEGARARRMQATDFISGRLIERVQRSRKCQNGLVTLAVKNYNTSLDLEAVS